MHNFFVVFNLKRIGCMEQRTLLRSLTIKTMLKAPIFGYNCDLIEINRLQLVPTKPYRVASSHRRGFYRRPSSGDEKRQKKSRNRRIYDDSDATDCSSRRPSYRIPDRKSYPYNPTYKNPHW